MSDDPQFGPVTVVSAFGQAWADHDLDEAMRWCAPDIVFESTSPPDGERFEGIEAVRAAWAPIFADPNSRFDVEDTIAAGDRVVQRVVYSWGDGHIRLVDVFRIRDGRVAEKCSYVKG